MPPGIEFRRAPEEVAPSGRHGGEAEPEHDSSTMILRPVPEKSGREPLRSKKERCNCAPGAAQQMTESTLDAGIIGGEANPK